MDLSRFTGPVLGLEPLVAAMPAGKLVYGSLWPIQVIEATLWEITSSQLPEATQAAILHGNLERLLEHPLSSFTEVSRGPAGRSPNGFR